MDNVNKRYYTRYKVSLEGRVATERGVTFPVEILDISTEGAELRTDFQIFLHEGESISIVIKWKSSIKAKAEVRWVRDEKPYIYFGIKFTEIDMVNRETLSSLLSEIALSSLSDIYFR